MKNLKKLVPVFALVLGIGLVFTQSAFKSVEKKTTNWYLLDETTGAIDPSYQIIDPEELCTAAGEKFCAREYNVVGGVPTTPVNSLYKMKN